MLRVWLLLFIVLWAAGLQAQQRHCATPHAVPATQFGPPTRLASGCADTLVMRIPVVVHVLHKGEPVGVGSNISDQRINEQIRILNEDFRRMPGTRGFNSRDTISRDARIEFVLAGLDPQDQPTNGIVRVNSNQSWVYSQEVAMKALSLWPSHQYMNIWVSDLTDYLGYAQYPASTLPGLPTDRGPATDGVVIGYKYFGLSGTQGGNYNLGRTATHEVGHFLGLLHIWGDGDCTATDYCPDTPAQNGAVYGCPSNSQSCASVGLPKDQIENYMNFTNDVCMNVFTICQIGRMRDVLCNSPRRNTLVNNAKIVATPQQPVAQLEKLRLYPNPVDAGQLLQIAVEDSAPRHIRVYDLLGKRLLDMSPALTGTTSQVFSLPTQAWTPGIYIVQVIYSNNQAASRKLVIR